MQVTRGLSWIALSSMAGFAIACTNPSPDGAGSGSSAPSTPATSAMAAAYATGSAATASGSALPTASAASPSGIASLFSAKLWAGLDPTAIYSGKRPSGVIALLPKDFRFRLSLDGEGLTAMKSLDPGVATAHVSFAIDKKTSDPAELDALCDASWWSAGTWQPAIDVEMEISVSGGRARVWKGSGKRPGTQEAREALILSAVLLEKLRSTLVAGCGSWDPAHPELAGEVAMVLKSVRLGSAPPNDVNGL